MKTTTLKDVAAAKTPMERALACSRLVLKRTGEFANGEVAPDRQKADPHHQEEIGTIFGEWEVIGPTYYRYAKTTGGKINRYPTTPVRCTCPLQTKRDVGLVFLRSGHSRSCHGRSATMRAANKSTWEQRVVIKRKRDESAARHEDTAAETLNQIVTAGAIA